MAKYKYLITDKYGKEKKGTMEAVSEEAAMRKLKGEGSIVLELSEAFDLDNASWNITIGNPVKKKDITIFCKQFYSITSQELCLWEYSYLCAHFCLKRLREKQDLVWATLNSWRVSDCVSDLDILYWH